MSPPPLRSGIAPCADYTTDLQPGEEVGLIDYGRIGAAKMGPGWNYIIQPGRTGQITGRDPKYNPDRDGINQPVAGRSPAGTLYNLIMEPGARKWRPKYRAASITAIDRDKQVCDVLLDYDLSRNTGRLDFPDVSGFGGEIYQVPIDYMDCVVLPFTLGDQVVVEFRREGGRNRPYVIGFVEQPLACPIRGTFNLGIYFTPYTDQWVCDSNTTLAYHFYTMAASHRVTANANFTLDAGTNYASSHGLLFEPPHNVLVDTTVGVPLSPYIAVENNYLVNPSQTTTKHGPTNFSSKYSFQVEQSSVGTVCSGTDANGYCTGIQDESPVLSTETVPIPFPPLQGIAPDDDYPDLYQYRYKILVDTLTVLSGGNVTGDIAIWRL